MTRLMGDAIHANVPFLARVPGLGLAGGYNTGSPDIQWTDADWAMFPGIPHVIIDQAYGDTNVAEAHAIVFDVESGAFAPAQAAALIDANTAVRPTIYVNESNMAETIISAQQSPNWHGDVWLALPGWQSGQPLPPLPAGCQYVAIQNQLDVNGLYDLSIVIDPAWPAVAADPPPKGKQVQDYLVYGQKTVYLLRGTHAHAIQSDTDLATYVGAGILEIGGPRQGGRLLTTAEEAAFVKDFPAGNPAITVTTPPPPPVTISLTGTATPS